MLKPFPQWLRRHPKLAVSLSLLAAFLLVNLVAYRHAHAMTHFVDGGAKTANPEALSSWEKAQVLLTGVTIPRPVNTTTPESLGLSFEVHRFPARDGCDLEGWFLPHPHPKGLVLLFHGYASCKANLLPEARTFHELGFATLLVDFRGSGGSGGSETTVGVREAEDVAGAVTYAQETWMDLPLILYGQSMGSAAILRAVALGEVQPQALVLECPFDRLLSTVGNRFTAMGLPAIPGAALLVFWGGVQEGFKGFRHNPVEYARAVECPVLMLHGEADLRVTPEQLQAVYQNLAGEKEFHSFAGVGHESYARASPEEWKDCLSGFLARHLGRTDP